MKSYRIATLLLVALAPIAGCIPDLAVDAPAKSGSCEAPPQGLEPLLDAFPPCDLTMCGPAEADRTRGRCVDANQLDESQKAQLAPCGTSYLSYCVPTALLLANGFGRPTTCASLEGAEGRCMSLCVPLVQEQQDQLPQSTCPTGELCAPCFDPISGETTGACTSSTCDAPADPEPVLFDRCCSDRAVCVPTDAVPEDKQGSLQQSTCTDDHLCVPEENTDPSYVPPSCTSGINGPGACTSTCVQLANIFQQQDCVDPNQRCIPCAIAGVETGACL